MIDVSGNSDVVSSSPQQSPAAASEASQESNCGSSKDTRSDKASLGNSWNTQKNFIFLNSSPSGWWESHVCFLCFPIRLNNGRVRNLCKRSYSIGKHTPVPSPLTFYQFTLCFLFTSDKTQLVSTVLQPVKTTKMEEKPKKKEEVPASPAAPKFPVKQKAPSKHQLMMEQLKVSL